MSIFFDPLFPTTVQNTAAAIVANEPFTLACWVYPTTLSLIRTMMGIGDGSGATFGYFALGVRGDQPGKAIYAFKQNTSGTQSNLAQSTTGVAINTWYHACGVFAADNSITVYLNGANNATATNSTTDPGMVRTSIGINAGNLGSGSGEPFNGNIAEAGIWNVALTADEVASLAKGFSPGLIRPASLLLYTPLIRAHGNLKSFVMTGASVGTIGSHPRIIY